MIKKNNRYSGSQNSEMNIVKIEKCLQSVESGEGG